VRQTLLRIRVDDLWSFAPVTIDGREVTAVGAGVLLLLWVLYGAVMLLREWRSGALKEGWGRLAGPFTMWLAVTVVLLSLPAWAPRFLPHGLPVFGYGTMVFLGFVFGGWAALGQAKRVGIEPEAIWDLVTWVFVAGVGGARLFYLVQKHETVFARVHGPRDFLLRVVNLSDGGLVLLGGVLAVVVAVILFCRRRGISPLRMGDVLVAPFFIGLGFGRIGCLMNGCCFGDRCTLFWAVHFPQGSAAWGALVERGFLGESAVTTYGLHPTQIYASITAFLLAGLTAAYFRRRPYDGAVLVVGMLLYATKRFVLEFLRGDELGQFGTMFTVSQWISAGIFAGGLVLWAWLAAARSRGGAGLGLTSRGPAAGRG
jgi:phosphatidylglycerol:prolipoprotein diacylglycerol transferase